MEYRPHGDFHLECRGRIVFGRFASSWNVEGVRSMLTQYTTFTELFQDAPWAALHDHRGLSGSTADAMAALHQGLVMGGQNNLCHAALIIDDFDMARAFLGQAYEGTGIEHQFFFEREAGLAWLVELGYTVDSSS